MPARDFEILSGRGNEALSSEIADYLGINLTGRVAENFPSGENRIQVEEDLRNSHIFVIQSHGGNLPVDKAISEQLIMIDASSRASAKEVTAVCPYFGYARQDKKTAGREPISAALWAKLFKAANADRMVCVDLHAGQIQGFFDGPFDHLTAFPVLSKHVKTRYADEIDKGDLVLVSPDFGRANVVHNYQNYLNVDSATVKKKRSQSKEDFGETKALTIEGDVKGNTCIIVDDMIDTGGTIETAANLLNEHGAKEINIMATHGILSDPALRRLSNTAIKQVILTNTLPLPQKPRMTEQEKVGMAKIEVVSVAKLIADAIDAIAYGKSVSHVLNTYKRNP